MKKHAIIPVFIPHRGCPNECVFCNQKAITARSADVTPEDIHGIADTYLSTLTGRGLEVVELAFFGGSFTGLPIDEQSAFLAVACDYKQKGIIDKIRLSTRPDYIDNTILNNLKRFNVDIIELGVQSFDASVLAASNRGHKPEAIYHACSLIKSYGFELGIQLMIGLPEDSTEKCLFSARETARIGPSTARLYPTVILNDTRLKNMYLNGSYRPLSLDEAVATTREMYKILTGAGINIIRVGLKSTDLITSAGEGGETVGHTYHPAFRQLVEGEIARESLEQQLQNLINCLQDDSALCNITFTCSGTSFSNMVGNSGCNKKYFQKKYPHLTIRFAVDESLEDMIFFACAE